MSTPNRLAREKSPYLLQHAHNPVDWYPWGGEAFEKARREQKPVFLSVGYSTCHWCHVMERESFEDPETARLLNEHFVSIKVDREERPDVDRVYMTFVQATTGSGGWPMSVWLTPELEPFAGGTYFPPQDRYGRPGFKTVLRRLAQVWKDERGRVLEQSAKLAAMLREYGSQDGRLGAGEPGPRELDAAFQEAARTFDPEEGGFGSAPKFPRPAQLDFLLRFYQADPTSAEGQQARDIVFLTLQKMADGGIHDHLGGGFHRYSVDRFWHVPHFEKMLYDQAQLACTYIEAWRIGEAPRFRETARGILDYVLREMTSPGGGFHSAEDADSLPAPGAEEKREGAFYVWSRAEIDEVLGEDAAHFCEVYGIEEAGNAPEGSDPHGEFTGLNILIRRRPDENATLACPRQKILARRASRPRPHLDDKILASWNGLMISAFARAARAWDDVEYLSAARAAAAFLRREMYRDGRLLRGFREGPGATEGFCDDYAAAIGGLIDLYEASGEIEWLRWAAELRETQDTFFLDAKHGGYFSAAAGDAHLLVRLKEDHDGAEPSPSSLAALNALRLARLLDDATLAARAAETIRAFSQVLHQIPASMPAMLTVLELSLSVPRQIVIAGSPDFSATRALAREARAQTGLETALLYADGGEGQAWLAQRLPFIETAIPVDGKPAAYICENFTCRLPILTPAELRAALR